MPDDVDLHDEWRAEFKAAALRYQQRDPAGYRAILDRVFLGYTGFAGEYKARMAHVQKRCAEANHFPDFETWKAARSSAPAGNSSDVHALPEMSA